MKLFSMFGVLALAVGSFAADQGTKDDPLTISSVQELLQFRNAVLDSGMYKGVKLKNGGEGLHFLERKIERSVRCFPPSIHDLLQNFIECGEHGG